MTARDQTFVGAIAAARRTRERDGAVAGLRGDEPIARVQAWIGKREAAKLVVGMRIDTPW
jgi:hypothetical protein